MSRKGKRLTQEEFTRLMEAHPRTSRMIYERIHKILVDGQSQSQVAEEEGVSLAAVTMSVTRYWKSWLNMNELPRGMERVEATLTTQQAEIVRGWARENVFRRTQNANNSDS